MKKFILILVGILVSALIHAQAPYCGVSYSNVPCNQPGPSNSSGNSINDFINSFNTTGAVINVSNNNSGCTPTPNNYVKYNCNQHLLKVNPGQTITCNLQAGITYSQGFAIFIDWNQNNVFDIPAERVTATPGVPAAGTWVALNFTVPAAQADGVYRMRVRCAYATNGTSIDPCINYSFGETEDYDLFVNMDPTVNSGTASVNNSSVCTGQSVALTLAGHSGNVLWQSAPAAGGPWTNITGATSATYNTPGLTGNTCYRAAVTNCGTTVFSNVVCVTIAPPPSISVTNPTICVGGTAAIDATVNPTGGTFNWNNGQTTSSISVSPTTTTSYTVTYNAGGCVGTATATVTVNPLPAVTITGDTDLCLGDATTLTANNGDTYVWNTGAITSDITQSPQSTTDYTVTATDVNGCVSATSVTVVVNPIPVASFSSNIVCEGNPTTFTDNSSISSGTIPNVQWSISPTTTPSANQYLHTFSGGGTYPVTLTVTSNAGCSNSITLNALVHSNPVVQFSSTSTAGCNPLCFSFIDQTTVANASVAAWEWYINNQLISTNSSPYHCINEAGLYDVQLTTTSSFGCASTQVYPEYLDVFPSPIADFALSADSVPIGSATVLCINLSTDAISYEWNFGDNTTSTETSPSHEFTDLGIFCIELIATSANGCTDIERKCVKVYQEFYVFIPNAFTPNDDGHNDIFFVQGYGIKKVEMVIYDRWGRELFFSDNQLAGWNGYELNSQTALPSGIYVYKVTVTDYKNIERDYFGKINMIR